MLARRLPAPSRTLLLRSPNTLTLLQHLLLVSKTNKQFVTNHMYNSLPLTFLCMSQTTVSFGNPELTCSFSSYVCKAVER